MKTTLVRYRTTPEHAETNQALVREVYRELRSLGPTGFRYATFRLADGTGFLHLATVESPEHNPLLTLESFKAFQAQLKGRCVEPPAFTDLTRIDSYGWEG